MSFKFHFLCFVLFFLPFAYPIPSYQSCLSSSPYFFNSSLCQSSLTLSDRLASLFSLPLSAKIALIAPDPNENTCNDHTKGVKELAMDGYMWLVETNSNVAADCRVMSEKKGSKVCVTTFVGPLGLAAAFNRTMWKGKGDVIATELRACNNMNVPRIQGPKELIGLTGYGPNINILRDPRFGRASELPGEDPFLNGAYAVEFVRGMQTEDANGHPKMMAYLKHFDAYSREKNRSHGNADISAHDLFDTYLAQFEKAFTEGKPTGAMSSYNSINGVPSAASHFLIQDVVRTLWNQPDAHISTDCSSIQNLVGAPAYAPTLLNATQWSINNGTDLEMGSTVWSSFLQASVELGLVNETAVDAAIRHGYLHHIRAGRFDPVESVEWTKYNLDDIASPQHLKVAHDAALQSFVLLKNDGVLPLSRGQNIAVVGPMAVLGASLLDDYHGDDVCPDGKFSCIPTIGAAISGENTGTTNVALGVDINSTDTSGILEAVAYAKSADVIILALGIDDSICGEGSDRVDISLPGLQLEFAAEILSIGKPVVLILVNGGAIAINPLLNNGSNAIVEAFNPSVTGAIPLAQTLFGDSNKFGKLVYTIYPEEYVNQIEMDNYNMAAESGSPGRTYRYYTGVPTYPFGYGLSYTTFNLKCNNVTSLQYVCAVINTGKITGDEVVQVYHSVGNDIRSRVNHPVPIKNLVNFERVTVDPNAEQLVTFSFDSSVFLLINAEGKREMYTGTHFLTFTNGVSALQTFEIVV